MPIYEYRRPDGTTFELLQSFSDEPLTEDPHSGVPVERVLHAPAVHFKGKGFYNTDYGKRSRQRDGAAEASGGETDGSGSDGKGAAGAADAGAKGTAGAAGDAGGKGGDTGNSSAGRNGATRPAAGRDTKPARASG